MQFSCLLWLHRVLYGSGVAKEKRWESLSFLGVTFLGKQLFLSQLFSRTLGDLFLDVFGINKPDDFTQGEDFILYF